MLSSGQMMIALAPLLLKTRQFLRSFAFTEVVVILAIVVSSRAFSKATLILPQSQRLQFL
jgi:hypothetical protein